MKANNPLLNTSLHVILLIAFAFVVTYSYGFTMLDDGWRHLTMAFHQETMQSWGNLFINSLYKEYDPWFLWHKLLNSLDFFVAREHIPTLINTFSYSFISIWTYILLKKNSSLPLYFILILAAGIPLFCIRYYSVRPDLLSGLFILSAILIRNNKWPLVVISLIYFPFYYVFWFFFGYLGFVKLILKEYKEVAILFCMTLTGFAFHLWVDFDGYVQIMQYVLNNDTLINGYSVGESKTFFIPQSIKDFTGSTPMLLFFMVLSILFLNIFKPKNRLYQYLILFMPIIILQIRFYQLLQPLILVCFVLGVHQFIIHSHQTSIGQTIQKIFDFFKAKTLFGDLSSKGRQLTLLFIVLLFFGTRYSINYQGYQFEQSKTEAALFFQSDEYKDKRIFLSFMGGLMQRAIFFNPSGHYMPNCSLGWVDLPKDIREIYFKIYQGDEKVPFEEFSKFIKYNNFDYLVIVAPMAQNVDFTSEEIDKLGYRFEKITKGNIVFGRK